MGVASGLQALSAIGQGFGALGGAISQANAVATQGEYQKQQYEFNQKLAENQASDAIRRGDQEALQVREQGKKAVTKAMGSARVSMAAQGVDSGSGSSAKILDEIATTGTEAYEQDALTIRSNAWREAWGYKVQAQDYGSKAKFSKLAAENESRNTLLTGGMKAIGYGMEAGSKFYEARGNSASTNNDAINGFTRSQRGTGGRRS